MKNPLNAHPLSLGAWLLSDSLRTLAAIILIVFLPMSKATAETCIIVALLSWTFSGQIREVFKKPLFLTLLILAAILLSWINVPREHFFISIRGLWKWLRVLSVFWIFYTLILHGKEKTQNKLALIFLVTMAFISLDGFFQFISGTDLLRHMTTDPGRLPRMKASFSAPTHLAFFLSLTLPLIASWIYQADEAKKRALKYFYLGAGTFFLIAFILTFSRGAMMATVLSFLFMALRLKIKPSFLGIFILGTSLLLVVPAIRYNFVETLTLQDISLTSRLGAWKTAWHMIQHKPFFGVGCNLYHTLIPQYASPGDFYLGYAHNSYLQLGSELGLFGLISFLILMAGTLKMEFLQRSFWISKPNFYDFLFTGLLSLWMQSFFDNHFFAIQPSVLLAMTWAFLIAGRTTRTVSSALTEDASRLIQ